VRLFHGWQLSHKSGFSSKCLSQCSQRSLLDDIAGDCGNMEVERRMMVGHGMQFESFWKAPLCKIQLVGGKAEFQSLGSVARDRQTDHKNATKNIQAEAILFEYLLGGPL